MSSPTPYLVDTLSRAALRLLRTAGGQTFESDEFSVRLIGPDAPDQVADTLAGPKDMSADVNVVADYTLQVDAPRRVMELTWSADDMLRILVFSRGGWEQALLTAAGIELDPAKSAGTSSWRRLQGTEDALLNRVLTDNGLSEVPLASFRQGKTKEHYMRPRELTPERTGPISAPPSEKSPAENARLIKEKAAELGAEKVGIARLLPEYVQFGADLSRHTWVIGLIHAEDYDNVLVGAAAIEEGAHDAYRRCAESSTALGHYIRDELGFDALAHHNDGCEVQALPALFEAGIGELGRHGSMINPDLGAFWRPGMVTTDLPLEPDAPLLFGVQEYCMNCRLCETACPGDAISPAEDYIMSGGVKRWLIDNEKCFPYSRLQPEYCHICVDVCPYIHKENGNAAAKSAFKQYLGLRKKAGAGASKADVAGAS